MQVLSSYHSARVAVGVVETRARPAVEPQISEGPAATPAAVRPAECGTCNDQPSTFEAGAESMKYRRSERTSLYIETQEGDIVRLRFKSRESAKLDIAHAEAAGSSSTDIELRTRSASKLSIRVEGDLSAEELAAIQSAIEQAGELAEDFFDGDLHSAFASAADLDVDADQLAKVSLRMRASERLTYSAYGYASSPRAAVSLDRHTPDPGTELAAPADAPESCEAATCPPAEDGGSAPASDAPLADTAPAAAEPVVADAAAEPESPSEMGPEEPVAAAPDAGSARANVFQALGSFLSSLMDGLSSSGASTGQIDVSLKLRIFEQTLVSISESRPDVREPLPELVRETVDALAEQDAAPLEAVA